MSREKGPDEIFCRSCGEPIKKKAEICPECGVANEYTESQQGGQGTRQETTSASRAHRGQETSSPVESVLSAPGSAEHDPSDYTTTTSDRWHYGVAGGVALWILGFAMPEGSPVAGVFFLVAWALLPASIYYDRQWLRATTNWNPQQAVWITLAVIPLVNIVAGVVYLIRRADVSEVSSPNGGYQAEQEEDPALARLRERYSKGELTDAEFEQKVEQIVGTEDRETAATHVRASTAKNERETNDQ